MRNYNKIKHAFEGLKNQILDQLHFHQSRNKGLLSFQFSDHGNNQNLFHG